MLPRRSYAIGMNSAKKLERPILIDQNRRRLSIFGFDLVEERIAQAVGVGVPLPRSLVGSQSRRPQRIRAIAAMHREVEPVAEEQLRPLPPGAELLDPAQQVVAIDQRRRHV